MRSIYLGFIIVLIGCQGQVLTPAQQAEINKIARIEHQSEDAKPISREEDSDDSNKQSQTVSCAQELNSTETENIILQQDLDRSQNLLAAYEDEITRLRSKIDRIVISKTAEEAFQVISDASPE